MNNTETTQTVCTVLLAVGALVASIWGVVPFDVPGAGGEFTSLRGEIITLDGVGLYHRESVSFADQGRAQDWVTIFLGVPLLVLSWAMTRRGDIRARVVHAGTLAYFLYTYLTYAYLLNFNQLYLLYVALFGLSLWAFVTAIARIDVLAVEAALKERFPYRLLGGYLVGLCSVLGIMWMGRIVPALLTDTAPFGLEHYTSLGIQTSDLGIVVPAGIISGVMMWRRHPHGLLFGAVLLMKLLTMGVVLVAMIISAAISGIPSSLAETVIFGVILALGFLASGAMVWWIRPRV